MPFRASIPTPRILIIDPDVAHRAALNALLQAEGYEVFEEEEGEAAHERIAKVDPDVVVLEVRLPGQGSVEVCQRLRALGIRVPVVFVGDDLDREVRIRCKAAGADDFLVRPVDDAELLVRLRNLVSIRAAQRLDELHRRNLEAELRRTRDNLLRVERLATLGNLAAGVGHELKNVLTVFRSVLGEMKQVQVEGRTLDREDMEALDWVSEHLGVHARHLQELGRPPGDDVRRPVDLCEVVEGALALLRASGRTRFLSVKADLSFRPAWVSAERTRIEQILVNLVNNAVDAVESAGRSDGRIEVHLVPGPGGFVACEVRDNGCGIPGDVIGSVLEPWFTTKGPGKGTGLGLAVVRSLVQDHGGELSLESEEGRGATFRFTLPLIPAGT